MLIYHPGSVSYINTLKQKVEAQGSQGFRFATFPVLCNICNFYLLCIKKEKLSCKSKITTVSGISQLVDPFHENAQIFIGIIYEDYWANLAYSLVTANMKYGS